MNKFLIKNACVINAGEEFYADILIKGERIEKIDSSISMQSGNIEELDATGLHLLPGVIDDQVHFRDPGLTHKGDLYSESKAAIAGGVTSFMDMPNTNPQAVTQQLLQKKYELGASKSLANFSFFMGTTNDNADEVLKTNPETVCGIKIFLGASTGNMLVDNIKTLEKIFAYSSMIKALHCEDEPLIQQNLARYKQQYGDDIPVSLHPMIRSGEACYLSSEMAINLAKRYESRIHILHLSTAREISLLNNEIPLHKKTLTAEVCAHHLWFDDSDYDRLGTRIKWNPAIKTAHDKESLLDGLLSNHIDLVATDHAPHTTDEKNNIYTKAPSGGPLIQHSLVMMLEFYHQNKIGLSTVVEKMCHNPAILYRIIDRGFIREGYFADLVLVDMNAPWKVNRSNILYKCGWSPLESTHFQSQVKYTFVNGHPVFAKGMFDESKKGKRLSFYIR